MTIREYVDWHYQDQHDAQIPVEFESKDFYLPECLGSVDIASHIGMRFAKQWTLAMELVRYLQPTQGLQVLKNVIKSMDVEWRG